MTQRQGLITCIPKEDKPRQCMKNWRPISLLNTTYKIASSCIANRLKGVLPDIISKFQRGLLKGQHISDNIRLMCDTMVHCVVEKIPGLLLLLDFEKAFDSISWSFYFNPTASVTVNGQYSEWFGIFR